MGDAMQKKAVLASVTSRGRNTIPVEVRKRLGVSGSDKLAFVIGDDGRVRVKKAGHDGVKSILGSAGTLDQPLSKHEMIAIAYEDRALSARKFR